MAGIAQALAYTHQVFDAFCPMNDQCMRILATEDSICDPSAL